MTTVIDVLGIGPREQAPAPKGSPKAFTILVRFAGTLDTPWEEHYNITTDDPAQWARDLIATFNATLRPNEKPREFVGIKGDAVETTAPEAHDWHKQNLMTVTHSGRLFDRMKCSHCGITGKRHGVQEGVKRDSQYWAKVYERCDTATAQIAKRKVSS